MLDCTKAVINNLNQTKYIRNINRVSKKATLSNGTKNLTGVNEKELSELTELETGRRVHNLKIFLKNYGYLRFKRFVCISLPAIIGAATIGSFIIPTKFDKVKKLSEYSIETIHLDSENGEIVETENAYYDGWSREASDPNTKIISGATSRLYYRITDGIDSISAKFTIYSDGKLSTDSAEAGHYIDLTDYDPNSYEEIESKYSLLFDEIVDKLETGNYLSKSEKEIFNTLKDSDKKQIIVDIVNYTKISDGNEVPLKASRWPLRVILTVVCVIYAICLFKYFEYEYLNTGDKLRNEDGYLRSSNGEESVFFGPTEYKEVFLAAEKDRIKNIYDIAARNLEEPMKILTKYEKKVLLKSQKTN